MIEIDEHEQIVKVIWDHWFILIGKICVLVLAIVIPVVSVALLHLLPIEQFASLSGSVGMAEGFLLTAWLIIVWMVGWNVYTNYFLNVLLVTDIRIFDITQMGFFRRQSASFRIDHIQNVTVEQVGILQTLLNFGSIRFETAGENINFVAKYIPSPYDIKRLIDDMQDGELSRSQEVHLHQTTLDRISPVATAMQSEKTDDRAHSPTGTFIDDGL